MDGFLFKTIDIFELKYFDLRFLGDKVKWSN